MKSKLEKESTYVLFGSEAIRIYNISLKLLLNSVEVIYKVGEYDDVKEFVNESKNWDSFTEIDRNDYLKLLDNQDKFNEKNSDQKKKKRASIFNFFK